MLELVDSKLKTSLPHFSFHFRPISLACGSVYWASSATALKLCRQLVGNLSASLPLRQSCHSAFSKIMLMALPLQPLMYHQTPTPTLGEDASCPWPEPTILQTRTFDGGTPVVEETRFSTGFAFENNAHAAVDESLARTFANAAFKSPCLYSCSYTIHL